MIQKENILIGDFDTNWISNIKDKTKDFNLCIKAFNNGKDVQECIYNNKEINTLIINLEIKDFSILQVLKYVKATKPNIKIFVIYDDLKSLNDSLISKHEWNKLGVQDVLIKTKINLNFIKKEILDNSFFNWNDIPKSSVNKKLDHKELNIRDNKFTSLNLNRFSLGTLAVFDYYIKLSSNKYIKIINKGESFTKESLSITNKVFDEIYFKSADRKKFIGYTNNLLTKMNNNKKISNKTKLKLIKSSSEKYEEEILSQGISKDLLREGRILSTNIKKTLMSNDTIQELIYDAEKKIPSLKDKSFFISVFSSIICKNLPWAGEKTSRIVGEAAFLCDLGLLKIKNKKDLIDKESTEYKNHPRYTLELLNDSGYQNEEVKNAILHHHEHNDKSGFPQKLSSIKIYPLGKILSFCSELTEYLIEEELSPQEGIFNFLRRKELIYDKEVVEAFLLSINDIKEKKEVS